jgi:hypothetical protein
LIISEVIKVTIVNFHTNRRRHSMMAVSAYVFLALASSVSAPVQANGFLLAPTRLFFEGSARAQELTIMNKSDETRTYRLRLEDRILKADGEYEVTTDPAQPGVAAAMLRLSVRQIVIPARESVTIRVILRKPTSLANGEFRSHLVVTEQPMVEAPPAQDAQGEGIAIKIIPVFSISIPVMIRNGPTNAQLRVSNIVRQRVESDPNIENILVNLDITGNRSMFVDLRLVSPRQRRGTPMYQANGVPIYWPINSRQMQLSLNAEQTAKLRTGTYVLQYQEVDKDGKAIGPASEMAF